MSEPQELAILPASNDQNSLTRITESQENPDQVQQKGVLEEQLEVPLNTDRTTKDDLVAFPSTQIIGESESQPKNEPNLNLSNSQQIDLSTTGYLRNETLMTSGEQNLLPVAQQEQGIAVLEVPLDKMQDKPTETKPDNNQLIANDSINAQTNDIRPNDPYLNKVDLALKESGEQIPPSNYQEQITDDYREDTEIRESDVNLEGENHSDQPNFLHILADQHFQLQTAINDVQTDSRNQFLIMKTLFENMQSQFSQLISVSNQQSSEIKNLRSDVSRLSQPVQSDPLVSQMPQDYIKQLQVHVKRLETENSSLRKGLDELQHKRSVGLSDFQEEFMVMKRVNKQLEDERNNLRAELQKKETDLMILRKKFDDNQKDKQRLRELENQKQFIQSEVMRLSTRVNTHQSTFSNDDLNRHRQLILENKLLQEKVREMQGVLNDMIAKAHPDLSQSNLQRSIQVEEMTPRNGTKNQDSLSAQEKASVTH